MSVNSLFIQKGEKLLKTLYHLDLFTLKEYPKQDDLERIREAMGLDTIEEAIVIFNTAVDAISFDTPLTQDEGMLPVVVCTYT